MDISKLRNDVGADKIGDTRLKGSGAAGKASRVKDADAGEKSSGAAAVTTNTHDKVKLSTDAQAVREGVEAAKSAPDTRAEKVAALKAQIKNGQYKVDEKAVAEKMIRQSLEEDIQGRME